MTGNHGAAAADPCSELDHIAAEEVVLDHEIGGHAGEAAHRPLGHRALPKRRLAGKNLLPFDPACRNAGPHSKQALQAFEDGAAGRRRFIIPLGNGGHELSAGTMDVFCGAAETVGCGSHDLRRDLACGAEEGKIFVTGLLDRIGWVVAGGRNGFHRAGHLSYRRCSGLLLDNAQSLRSRCR
jgi:hypothetical protein